MDDETFFWTSAPLCPRGMHDNDTERKKQPYIISIIFLLNLLVSVRFFKRLNYRNYLQLC